MGHEDDWDDWEGLHEPLHKQKKPKWARRRQDIIQTLELDYEHSGGLIDKAGCSSLNWAESIRAKGFHDAIGYCLNMLEETK